MQDSTRLPRQPYRDRFLLGLFIPDTSRGLTAHTFQWTPQRFIWRLRLRPRRAGPTGDQGTRTPAGTALAVVISPRPTRLAAGCAFVTLPCLLETSSLLLIPGFIPPNFTHVLNPAHVYLCDVFSDRVPFSSLPAGMSHPHCCFPTASRGGTDCNRPEVIAMCVQVAH